MQELTHAYIRGLLPRRDPEGHKGTFGRVLGVCGSVGYTGAPVFAARELTEYAMTPTDMVERIPCAYKEILQADLG